MKRTIKTIAVIFLLAMLPVLSNAQPPDPGGVGGPGTDPGAGDIPAGGGAPIDGGLSMLLLLGAAYGTKKMYKVGE